MGTIDDIARETGYHRTTVSKILAGDKRCYASEQTREIIRAAAARMHYVPNYFARSLKAHRSRTVGVVAGVGSAWFPAATLSAIAEHLVGRDYMPLFCEAPIQPRADIRLVNELRSRMVDGLIIGLDQSPGALLAAVPADLPCVFVASAPVPGRPTIVGARSAVYARAVRQLAAGGHRRIAFIGADIAGFMLNAVSTNRLKFEGYRSAMRQLGRFEPDLVFDCGLCPGAARALVARNAGQFSQITAVLAVNDRLAIEVMSGLADTGRRVPEDCAVIGFDDTEFARAVRPALTSFDPRAAEVGARAATMIMDLIAGQTVRNCKLMPKLVMRDSTGPRASRLQETSVQSRKISRPPLLKATAGTQRRKIRKEEAQ